MRLRTLSRAQLCTEMSYLDAEGRVSDRKVADLIRLSLSRWGLSPKRNVLGYARGQLRVAGIEDVASVTETLQRLVDLGECEEVYVGTELHLAPAEPRWIPIGDGVATYLGVSQPPNGLSVINGKHDDIICRLRVDTDEDAAVLQLAGIREVSVSEWLAPFGYLSHATRRMRQPARSDSMSLGKFWGLLEDALTAEGLPLGDDAEIRYLGGRPGKFFGRHDSSEPEGRWITDIQDGVWCAFRRGYGEAHWHPCVIAAFQGGKRVLDLYDLDEWRWAVLARGQEVGPEEIVYKNEKMVRLTFPAPNQLRAAMDIVGSPQGAWGWNTNPNCPDLWGAIAALANGVAS